MTDTPSKTTTFIVWALEIDEVFRAAYLAATGEAIQETPARNGTGTHFMAGSSRLSAGQGLVLEANPALAGAFYRGPAPPPWWEDAISS